jgi:hypothetical protein
MKKLFITVCAGLLAFHSYAGLIQSKETPVYFKPVDFETDQKNLENTLSLLKIEHAQELDRIQRLNSCDFKKIDNLRYKEVEILRRVNLRWFFSKGGTRMDDLYTRESQYFSDLLPAKNAPEKAVISSSLLSNRLALKITAAFNQENMYRSNQDQESLQNELLKITSEHERELRQVEYVYLVADGYMHHTSSQENNSQNENFESSLKKLDELGNKEIEILSWTSEELLSQYRNEYLIGTVQNLHREEYQTLRHIASTWRSSPKKQAAILDFFRTSRESRLNPIIFDKSPPSPRRKICYY